MKMSKYDKEAEQTLVEYAETFTDDWVAEMDQYLAMDPDSEKNFAKYGKRKYIRPQKRILRYAAIFLIVAFVGSIVIPIPQASAWQIWWLDLLFGENEEDIDVLPDNNEIIDVFVYKVPDNFYLVDEMQTSPTEYVANYINETGEYIIFMQSDNSEFAMHLDNENRIINTEVIGEFEVLVSTGTADIIFEITSDNSILSVQTNASYDVGKDFILGLKKKE